MADENSTGASESTENGSVQVQGDGQDVQATDQPAAQPPAQGNGWSMFKGFAIRMLIIYLISSFFRRGSTPTPEAGTAGPPAAPGANTFPKGMDMDMYVYLNEEEQFSQFNNTDALFWLEKGLIYGDWEGGLESDGAYIKQSKITASEDLKNNGSLFIHVFFVKAGYSPDPDAPKYKKSQTAFRSKRLNKFKKRRFHTTVNLLTGQTDAHPDLIKKDNSSFEILSHWHPNLTLNILDDHSPWTKGQVPAPLDEYIDFLPSPPGKASKYLPVVFFNDYWNMNSDYMPINDTIRELNLTLTFSPISLFRWQLYAAQGMRNKWYNMLGSDFMEESDEDQDSLKTTFLETNPYLLGLTIIVSIIHSIFEFLAFKNDIQFWKGRKSLEGLSVRSVFFNVFQSLIVVLYVLDNETNTVVRISVIVGLAIEVWKIFKVIDVKVDREAKLLGFLPKISYQDKSTYTQSLTKQYDTMAFKYLSWLLFPLLGGYAVYSLFYMEHRGWYSWVLSMLYGFLLTFGFIMMTPQLFINYKLKSVAHLPWRMMTYKALNTFIDDIFAFVIKMPTLYRIGCFRDDVVFFIFLYQRWIYRVDPSRVNEFGVSQEMLEQNGQTPQEGVQAIDQTPTQEGETPTQDGETPTQEGETPTQDGETPKSEKVTPKSEEEKKKD